MAKQKSNQTDFINMGDTGQPEAPIVEKESNEVESPEMEAMKKKVAELEQEKADREAKVDTAVKPANYKGVKPASVEGAVMVSASIKPEFQITTYQRDHCYVFRAWSFTAPKGAQAGVMEREHNISYSKHQFKNLDGSGKKKTARKKKTCSPIEYLKGVYDDKFELINAPKY